MANEFLARMGKDHTTGMPVEQRRAEFIFQIADTAADGGLLYAQGCRRTAKAAAPGGGDDVSQVSQLNGHSAVRLLQFQVRT